MSSAIGAEEDQQLFIEICCGISTTALLVYEYLVTFDREYELVWKRRFSAATVVFLLARYLILLEYIFNIVTMYPLSTRSCSALVWLTTALDLSFFFILAVFSSLRGYALSGRQWQVALLIFILSLASFTITLFGDVQQVAVVAPPPINCTFDFLASPELMNVLAYAGRSTTIAADIVVLVVTIHQTYWRRRAATEANLRSPLHTLILRDGTIYFLALLIINIADIIFIYMEETFQSVSYTAEFIQPITAILVSRFMLNLRELNAPVDSSEDSSQSSSTRSIRLTTFIEPLGAPLDYQLSFPSVGPNYSDIQEADEATGCENPLYSDEENVSDQASIRGVSEAESGPSVRE